MADTVADWLLHTPLYAPLSFADAGEAQAGAYGLLAWSGTCESYCPECGTDATFSGVVDQEFNSQNQRLRAAAVNIAGDVRRSIPWWEADGAELGKKVACTRDRRHVLSFHFQRRGQQIIKIGQYPSFADLADGETKELRPVFGKMRVAELNKAIGLAAHGAGIGAFAYLRRVFESLVDDAHQKAASDPGWDEEVYKKLRMQERLRLFAGRLPTLLVENYSLYGILSQHLHELSDEECLKNFDLVKQGILMIGHERLAAEKLKKGTEAFKKALSKMSPPVPYT
jgi:hypothetical protein